MQNAPIATPCQRGELRGDRGRVDRCAREYPLRVLRAHPGDDRDRLGAEVADRGEVQQQAGRGVGMRRADGRDDRRHPAVHAADERPRGRLGIARGGERGDDRGHRGPGFAHPGHRRER